MLLMYISAFRFVHKIVTSVHRYEQNKVGNKQFFEVYWQLIECSFVASTVSQRQHSMSFLKFCQHYLGGCSLTHMGHCSTRFAGVGWACHQYFPICSAPPCVSGTNQRFPENVYRSLIVSCCSVSNMSSTAAEYAGFSDCVMMYDKCNSE